jgi:Spy/CpxP family protein refolding chaperone
MLRNIKKLLAIACVTLAVGAVTVPNLVSAQNTTPKQSQKRGDYKEVWKKLNLTEAQKAQIKTIHENAKTQRQNVLTAEQSAQITAAQSGDRKGVRKALNLTDAQKQQMKAITESTKQQVEAILTAEQKQQIAKLRSEKQSQRGIR